MTRPPTPIRCERDWYDERGIELIGPQRKKPKETTNPRWTTVAALQETMEGQTNLRMVGKLSTAKLVVQVVQWDIIMYQAFVKVAFLLIILRQL